MSFYVTKGPEIFPGTSLIQRTTNAIRQLLSGPKHSHEVLRAALEDVFEDRRLGESAAGW